MATISGSSENTEETTTSGSNERAFRPGEELWRLLDYSTGKRIKGQWRDVSKMLALFTRANARHCFGMNSAEIQRLAEYIHDQNRPAPGTIEEYLALWPRPLDALIPIPEAQRTALLALDQLIRELPTETRFTNPEKY